MEYKKRPVRKTNTLKRTKPLPYARRTKKRESSQKDILMVQLIASVFTLLFVFGASKTNFDTAAKFTESLKYALHQQASVETMQQTVTDSVSTFKKIQQGILGFFGFAKETDNPPETAIQEGDTEEPNVQVTPIGQENAAPEENGTGTGKEENTGEDNGDNESAKKPIPPLQEVQ